MSVPHTWNLVAPGYATEIVPTFSQFAEDALELSHLIPGERVLDVATGPGTLAIAAARAGARVSAIDFSPRMLAELDARARREDVRGIDARVANAAAIPYEDETFDAAFSMFALNLVADRAAAWSEIRRVLRRDGRAVVGTPATMTGLPAFTEVRDIVHRIAPEIDFEGELPLGDAAELEHEMRDAGFSDVAVRSITRSLSYPSIAAIWAMAGRAGAPFVLAREAMGEDRWAHVSERIVHDLEHRFGAGPKTLDLTVHLARARK